MKFAPFAFLLFLSAAGCLDESAPTAPVWQIGGAFTEATSPADLADLEARLEHWDATLRVMESYPMQYVIEVEGGPACDEVREMLAARPYADSVGKCRAL